VWFLARGVGVTADALVSGLVVGTLLALFAAALGMLVSVVVQSNRVSLSLSLFLLIALFAPTQLPSSALHGWGDLLLKMNPITSGEHYVGKILVDGHGWREDVSWLTSTLIAPVLFVAAALLSGRFLRLGRTPGG
jgi:ABC-2 type transport system permease protein